MSWFKFSTRARRKAKLREKIEQATRLYFACNPRTKEGRRRSRECLDMLDECDRRLCAMERNGKAGGTT